MRVRDVSRWAAAAALALAATSLHAHDSWFESSEGEFTLVTGNRYPKADLVVPEDSFSDRGCASAGRSRACWAGLHPFDVVLEPRLIEVYLREVRPPDEVRSRWRALQAAGAPWQERYRKFARVEAAPPDESPAAIAQLRRPRGFALELVARPDTNLRAGSVARFVALSAGRPVAGLAVELVSERNRLGVWARSDEKGEVRWTLPFAGAWLVRAVALHPEGAAGWRSEFATFAFEASPAPQSADGSHSGG